MSEEIGKRIGDYQVLNELGRGGMGQVYRVRNVLSDRIEAMKILLPDVATRQELAARFLREIKVLASLNHPHIAALRTALTIDNQLVMIMEYVEGTTLAQRLEQGPIPVSDTLNYMDQTLDALSYAHRQNVIHRDIKPANIILTLDGVIKVMDFGIARSGTDRSLTMTGTTLGSLGYMSPEQVKGEATDARSDLYSVGISLYELVTGQRPFQAHSDYSIMAAHVKETPKPPIELEHDLPPALNEIILMAIAKDPAQRFQTADALRNALHSVSAAPLASQALPRVPAVTPDAAPTATLTVPVPAPAIQTPMTQAPVPQVPVPQAAPRVAPVPTPPSAPLAPPPHPSSHRGLYMTAGALIVLAVLVVAGIYVPRKSKTQATSPSQTQPAAAQSTGTSPQDGAQPAPTATPVSASSTGMTQPSAPTETAAPAEKSSATPANSMPGQPQPHPRKGSGSAKSGAGAVVNAGLQEAEAGAQSNPSQSNPSQSNPAAVPPANDAAHSAAAWDEVQDQVDHLSSRASAVDASLDRLQQQQNASGYGLRGDIVAKRASMKANLSKAETAVQQKDLEKAKKYLGLAQSDVEALERFLGH